MTRDEARIAALAEATRWIGTPYRHQGSALGAGADCLGLVRGVWRALYGREPEPLPPYSPAWAEFGGEERLMATFDRYLVRVDDPRPGEVVAWRFRRTAAAKHCAVLAEGGEIIHAYSGRTVCRTPNPPAWRNGFAGAWAWAA